MLDNLKFWIGEVENKNDPKKRGRIQVRIFGIHTKETARDESKGIGIPTEDLPWAMCSMPLTYGGVGGSGTVPPPAVMKGSWVFGISLDGDVYNSLLVLGVLLLNSNMASLATNPTNFGSGFSGNDQQTASYDNTKECMKNYMNIIEGIESGGNQNSTSSAGAVGVMQLLPNTAVEAYTVLANSASSNPELYNRFVSTCGLNLTPDQVKQQAISNAEFNRILGEGYYTQMLNSKAVGGDPILAAAAYNCGLGNMTGYTKSDGTRVQGYLNAYGNPATGAITYEEFADKIIAGGNSETGNYIKKFMKGMGPEGLEKCKKQATAQAGSSSGSTGGYGGGSQGGKKIWELCNNPLNLRVAGSTDYRMFESIDDSWASYQKQLNLYINRDGLTTPAQIISKWAPASDGNDTQGYIRNVSQWTGLNMNEPISASDKTKMSQLLSGMARAESSQVYSPEYIKEHLK